MPLQKATLTALGPQAQALYDIEAEGTFGGIVVNAQTGETTHLLSRRKEAAHSIGRRQGDPATDHRTRTEGILEGSYGRPYEQDGVRLYAQPMTHEAAHLVFQDGMPLSVRQAAQQLRDSAQNVGEVLAGAEEGTLRPARKGFRAGGGGGPSP